MFFRFEGSFQMITRKLHPCTIIPDHLYVERAADRQLRTVIDDMGRPAYILVSRQMGKTNLLINMKRERVGDIVLYLDLSNRFDSARKWFRNVIDSLLESYPNFFEGLEEKIIKQREGSGFEPNVEFDRHLRLLLRSCDRRVVIVLDEIDSLVGCSYSDVVLAQIRSMYFSRVNHAEYGRLTYVLSGVAEPSDLIRDKNISPFNIGEKIYLEDFDRSEFDDFIKKAGLDLSSLVVDSIFKWASGNPRITWDICSEIEDRLLSGEEISDLTVDSVVDKLYLRDYDRAPVDHIRTLVEADIQIRNAVIAIRYSKSGILDDKIKSKLYLAGIIKSIERGELKIKNRVIDDALSDRWIEQISQAQKSIVLLASEAYAAGNFDQSIKFYEEALSDSNQSSLMTDLARIEFGLAYMWVEKSSKAIAQFSLVYDQAGDPKLKQLSKLHIGTALLAEQEYLESIEPLLEAAGGEDHKTSVNAKLNLLVAYLKSGAEGNIHEALSLSKSLVSTLEGSQAESSDVALSTALFHQSTIYEALKDKEKSQSCLRRAIELSPIQLKPFLLISVAEKGDLKSQKISDLDNFVSLVADNEIPLSGVSDSVLGLSKFALSKALELIYEFNDLKSFDDFLGVVKVKYYRSSINKFGILNDLAEEAVETDPQTAFNLLTICAQEYFSEPASIESKIKLYRNLAIYSCSRKDDKWSMKYLRFLEESCPEDLISIDDVAGAATVIITIWNRGDVGVGEALKIWRKFEVRSLQVDAPQSAALLFIIMLHEQDSDVSYQYGKRFLSTIASLDDGSTSDLWTPLKKQADRVVSGYELSKYKSLGRNSKVVVKYGELEPVEKKFKYVEEDLKGGKCILVRVLEG
jgi:tetratricopeptide (TPR) repeat protein